MLFPSKDSLPSGASGSITRPLIPRCKSSGPIGRFMESPVAETMWINVDFSETMCADGSKSMSPARASGTVFIPTPKSSMLNH